MRLGKYTILLLGTLLIELLFCSPRLWLLLRSEETTGTVVDFVSVRYSRRSSAYCAVVEYQVGDTLYRIRAETNADHFMDEKLTLVYDPENKSDALVFTFTSFFLRPMIFSLPVFIFWMACIVGGMESGAFLQLPSFTFLPPPEEPNTMP